MTARGARLPASAGRLAAIAAAVAVGGVVGYQLLTRAAAGGTVTLALVLGLGALTVALLRPWSRQAPARDHLRQRRLVLADGYGAPNVVTGLAPAARHPGLDAERAGAAPPRHAGGHRLRRAHRDPHPLLGDPGTWPDGRLGDEPDFLIGLAIVLVVQATASRADGLRHSCEPRGFAAALLAGLTVPGRARRAGTGRLRDRQPPVREQTAEVRGSFLLEAEDRATGPLGDEPWSQSLVLALPLALWSMRWGPTPLTRWCAAARGCSSRRASR